MRHGGDINADFNTEKSKMPEMRKALHCHAWRCAPADYEMPAL